MANPPRSPLLGYNHNVKYGGYVFHVQTEDSGPGNPHIFTHLFFEGSILGSKRCEYEPSAPEEEVRALMQAQHKAILKDLKQKTYDERITRLFEARGLPFQSDPVCADKPQAAPAPTAVDGGPALPTAPTSVPRQLELPAVAMPEAAVLDLDALPIDAAPRTPTPEPLPMHLTKPAVPGPGTYTFRRPNREEFPGDPSTAPTPPPASLAPTIPKAPPARPITPVVVQRQVVVNAGAPTTTRNVATTPVRRRPVSGGPYVVKEGSHANIPGTVRRPEPAKPLTEAPAAGRATPAAEPPRAPEPRPPQESAPAAFVTDQSLDDVILAYLSQGDGKR